MAVPWRRLRAGQSTAAFALGLNGTAMRKHADGMTATSH
jgi:hypothetical protein